MTEAPLSNEQEQVRIEPSEPAVREAPIVPADQTKNLPAGAAYRTEQAKSREQRIAEAIAASASGPAPDGSPGAQARNPHGVPRVGAADPSLSAESLSPETPAKASSSPVEASEPAATPEQAIIAAERAKREARALERRARQAESRARSFEEKTSKWKEDPRALLEAAGIDPAEYSRALMNQALGVQPKEAPKSPESTYVEAVKKEIATFKEEQLERETTQLIDQKIAPVFNQAPDQYESLLYRFKGDARQAAEYVYSEMLRVHMRSGVFVPPEQAAKFLNDQEAEQLDLGIKQLIGTKRFSSRYKLAEERAAEALKQTPELPAGQTSETNQPAPLKSRPTVRTLTNNSITGVEATRQVKRELPTRDQRLKELSAKFGLK